MPGYGLLRRPRQRAFLRDLRAGCSVVPPFAVLPVRRYRETAYTQISQKRGALRVPRHRFAQNDPEGSVSRRAGF
jgi:hypothetical protein